MPVRINLLPRYVALRKNLSLIQKICIALGVIGIAAMALYYIDQNIVLDVKKQNLEMYKEIAAKTNAAKQATQKAQGDTKARADNVKFIVDASRTGAQRSTLLDMLEAYVAKDSIVSAIGISDGQNAKFTATVRNPDDYARFITGLRVGTPPKGPLFKEDPKGEGIPGFPKFVSDGTQNNQGNQDTDGNQKNNNTTMRKVIYPLVVKASGPLLNPITIPVEPGGQAPANPNPGGAPDGMLDDPGAAP